MHDEETSSRTIAELIADIPNKISVVLGETVLTTKQISELGESSVIELKNLAGAPVEVRANDVPIALAEVVVIDENFGVRITDVLTQDQQRERMRQGNRKFISNVVIKN